MLEEFVKSVCKEIGEDNVIVEYEDV